MLTSTIVHLELDGVNRPDFCILIATSLPSVFVDAKGSMAAVASQANLTKYFQAKAPAGPYGQQ